MVLHTFSNEVHVIGMHINKSGDPAIVMEFADRGSMNMKRLNTLWSAPGVNKVERRRKFNLDIVRAIFYMHKKDDMHRDLKPDNILCFGYARTAKISDFGLARVNLYCIANSAL